MSPVALSALDALVALENGLSAPLRRFVGDVLRDPKIGIPLLRCKASQKHHHAYPGGLLVHSMELMCLVDPLVQALMPFEAKAADLTRVGLLLHDVGKVLTVGESVRPHLARLARSDHESAAVLGYLFEFLASDYTTRGYPNSLVVEIVRMLDQLSTAVTMGKGLLPQPTVDATR